MNKTKIEWVKNPDGSQGYTWNPITGCLNHKDGLCNGGGFPCYAYRMAHGLLKKSYLENLNFAIQNETTGNPYRYNPYREPFYPRFWPGRIDKARLELINAKPRGIFTCDMSEWAGDWIPYQWQEELMDLIKEFHLHRFYLLTKQPQNLIKFSPFPDNCWVGVTATNTIAFSIAVKYLQHISAKVRFLSIEPMMSHIITNYWELDRRGIDWLIIGAQTGPYKPPSKIWVDEIIEACKKANIPYFLKDNLRPLMGDNLVQDIPRGYRSLLVGRK